MKKIMLLISFVGSTYISSDLKNDLEEQITPLMEKVIEWRHDIHQYPELSNREYRTAKKVENHLFCLLYTSPSPRDLSTSRMPSSA